MKRAARLTLLVTATLLLVLSAAAWWLFGTEAGLRFAFARADGIGGVGLRAEHLQGRLAGPLSADGLVIDTRAATITAAHAELDFDPINLLRGRVSFSQLHARALRIAVKAQAPDAEPSSRLLLPFSLAIDADVEGLAVAASNGREVSFRHIAVKGLLKRNGVLNAEHLVLEHAYGKVEARGTLAASADEPVQLWARWALDWPDLPRLAGEGNVTGTLARPVLDQQLSAPVRGHVAGDLILLGAPLQWKAQLDLEAVRLSEINPGWRAIALGGTVRAEGGSEALSLTADVAVDDPVLGVWRAAGRLEREAARWRVPELTLTQVGGAGQVAVEGLVQVEGAAVVDLALRWKSLGVPLGTSPSGALRVQGSLDDYHIDGSGELQRQGLPAGRLALEGQGNRNGLRIAHLEAQWLDGRVQGAGELGWRPHLSWRAELTLADIDPGELDPHWSGRVDARLATDGQWRRGERPRGRFALTQLGGHWRGYPLSGEALAELHRDGIRVDRLVLQSGSARLEASGDWGGRLDLHWALTAPQLEHLLPASAGSLGMQGSLAGPRAAPHLRLSARGQDLVWQGRRVGRLDMKGDVDLMGRTPWDIDLAASAITSEEVGQVDRLHVSGRGSPAQHQVRLEVDARESQVMLNAEGRYEDGVWAGQLRDGIISNRTFGNWTQERPARLTLAADRGRLQPWCWVQDQARLCMEGGGGPARGWELALRIADFPVAVLNPWLPRRDLSVSGRLGGDAKVSLRDGLHDLSLDVSATGGKFRFELIGDEVLETGYQRLSLHADGDAQGLRLRAAVELNNGDYARAEAGLPAWRPGEAFSAEQPVRGHAEVSLSELVWISLLVPDVVVPDGRLRADVGLAGTLGRPRVDGMATLEGGSVAVPPLGITLTELRVQVQGGDNGVMTVNVSARSGEGVLEVAGQVEPAAGQWSASLRARGENVEVMRIPKARVVISPDLALTVRQRHLRITGSVTVPEADIKLTEIASTVNVSPDVVVVDQANQPQRAARWTVESEVELIFGDKVRLEGYGLQGRLGGRLTVIEPARGSAIARGEVQVLDGRYDAYGQKLTIQEGRLLYANAPLDNPGIDFLAVQQIQDVTVGILATGRLRSPEVNLYSDPPMDDSQVLAYLVLGRALETASKEEAGLLQEAALSLGLAGGTRLAREIAGEFGVDVVQVEANTQRQQASVVLGKYLSPKLYVQYAVGLWESEDTLRVRYRLTEHWTLEAQSGTQSGADLLYTIEK